jgi:hypothetical protein
MKIPVLIGRKVLSTFYKTRPTEHSELRDGAYVPSIKIKTDGTKDVAEKQEAVEQKCHK